MTQTSLPIYAIANDIVTACMTQSRLILTAPTGSGKSTQVPQILLDRGVLGNGEVVVLQPRRLAARLLAAHVAEERGSALGSEVGYQVRLEGKTSPATRIRYVTEGILLRRLLTSPHLDGVSAILFDEFHERHVYGDITLARARMLQNDASGPETCGDVGDARHEFSPRVPRAVSRALVAGASVSGRGRISRARLMHGGSPSGTRLLPLSTSSCALVWTAISWSLCQVPMKSCAPSMPLATSLPSAVGHCCRCMASCPAEQDRAVRPSVGRKVVVATNVAETSITIEGVRAVIDSGLARMARFDPHRGINTLYVEPISQAAADQRAGRAGRTAPGRCLRLWTAQEHRGRVVHEVPEIRRIDLAEIF